LQAQLNYRNININKNINSNDAHPSTQKLSFWSIQYREEETYHDEDDEMMMIETIDFVRDGNLPTKESDACVMRIEADHNHQNTHTFTTDTNGMDASLNVINHRSGKEQILLRQQQQLWRDTVIAFIKITGIVVIATVAVVRFFSLLRS
jgi:hypothetical protein